MINPLFMATGADTAGRQPFEYNRYCLFLIGYELDTNFKLDRLERDKGSKVKVLASQGQGNPL